MKRQPNHIELEQLDVFNMMLTKLNRQDLHIDETKHWDNIGHHFRSEPNKLGQFLLLSETQIDLLDSDDELIEQFCQPTDIIMIGMAGFFTLDS